jgi:hypothetical protein
MTLGHEKLDVYRLSIDYVAWVYEKAGKLNGVHRAAESQSRKAGLDRMAAMLSRLGGRGYQVREDQAVYSNGKNGFDPDSDFDLDKEQPQPSVSGAYRL